MAKIELQDSPLSAKPCVTSFVGSAGRTRLNDITNRTPIRQKLILKPVSEEKRYGLPAPTGADYAKLLQENAALLKLLEERNGIIEYNNIEIQKFKVAVQKLQQQNWQLAQSNSLMLGELNLAKDRLKSVQHELSCSLTSLKTKALEVEELKEKLKTVLASQKTGEGDPPKGTPTMKDDLVDERKPPCRKRASASLACYSIGNVQSTDKDEDPRRSTRRRTSQSSELGISDLPEVEEAVNEDHQPPNCDMESETTTCTKGKDEQEIENLDSRQTEQKITKIKMKHGRSAVKSQANESVVADLAEVKGPPKEAVNGDHQPPNCDMESETTTCTKGKDEHEIENLDSRQTEQKITKIKMKHGRSAVKSQANESVVADLAEVKGPPKEGITMKLDSQPLTTKLSEGKGCEIQIRNLPVHRNGRRKEESIMRRRAAQRNCTKEKMHKTSIPVSSKQTPIVIEDSPTGHKDSSCSTSCSITESPAENMQSDVAASAVGEEEKHERKSLPEPGAKEAEPPAGRPSRRVTIGISYKERPINIKMRRPN